MAREEYKQYAATKHGKKKPTHKQTDLFWPVTNDFVVQ